MIKLADIHCHILPYVDDGARDISEAVDLLYEQKSQGVTEICLTPHLRKDMFETPDEKIVFQYDRLRKIQSKEKIGVKLHLSREYHLDRGFIQLLKKHELLTYPDQKSVLVECSYSHSLSTIVDAVRHVRAEGYQPVLAHVERYGAIQEDKENADRLIREGARLQVNASSILGKNGFRTKRLTRWLLRQEFVFAAASDAHDMTDRTPMLLSCFKYVEKKLGTDYAVMLLRDNPMELLRP